MGILGAIGGIATGLGSIFGGGKGGGGDSGEAMEKYSEAITKAAQIQADAATYAAQMQYQAAAQATALQKQMYVTTRADYAPWRYTGAAAENVMGALMGLYGMDPYANYPEYQKTIAALNKGGTSAAASIPAPSTANAISGGATGSNITLPGGQIPVGGGGIAPATYLNTSLLNQKMNQGTPVTLPNGQTGQVITDQSGNQSFVRDPGTAMATTSGQPSRTRTTGDTYTYPFQLGRPESGFPMVDANGNVVPASQYSFKPPTPEDFGITKPARNTREAQEETALPDRGTPETNRERELLTQISSAGFTPTQAQNILRRLNEQAGVKNG